MQATRRGGWQLFYRSDGRPVRQTESEAAPAVDTRVAGKGYVVAWQPEVFLETAPTGWAPAPDWVYERPARSRSDKRPASMATRSEILSWLGSIAAHAVVTEAEYRALLRQARDAKRIIARDLARPWTDADLDKLAAEAAKWEPTEEGEFVDEPEHLAQSNAADLLLENIAPLRQALAGLLPEGLGVLGAPPKVGKSLLAYQVSVELALGGDLFGIDAEVRDVLYYALEDGRRRSQSRIRALLLGRLAGIERLELRWTAPRLGGPLETEVSAWLDRHPLGVVIVDVLSKVRASGRAGLNAYDEDYSAITGLHTAARTHPGSTVLLITHDRKAGSDDWMTRITGTRGVTGAADFVIFIYRKRTELVGKIYVTGRDVEDASYDVEFTGSGWRLAGFEEVMASKSPTRRTVFNWVKQHGPAWQKAIAEGTGITLGTIYARVHDMAEEGQLIGGPDGYRTPDDV
jgi:hypothetical protein